MEYDLTRMSFIDICTNTSACSSIWVKKKSKRTLTEIGANYIHTCIRAYMGIFLALVNICMGYVVTGSWYKLDSKSIATVDPHLSEPPQTADKNKKFTYVKHMKTCMYMYKKGLCPSISAGPPFAFVWTTKRWFCHAVDCIQASSL